MLNVEADFANDPSLGIRDSLCGRLHDFSSQTLYHGFLSHTTLPNMSVIIDVATSPASAKSPGSFLDMNDLALSPSDSLQGAISPLKPISLDDAVQSVQRLVNDDTDGPEDILLAQGLSQRLELSIQAAKEAMETLKTDNMDEADPDKAKRNLRVFGQLYSRLVRKEMRLYSDQMESIEAEGQDASVGVSPSQSKVKLPIDNL